MTILTNLLDEAKQYFTDDSNELRIDNLILGKTLYTIKNSDTVFTDMNFCLVLFEDAYGFSYFQDDIDYSLSNHVNKNALGILDGGIPSYLRVALLDALFCLINKQQNSMQEVLKGNLRQKARERARILLSSVPDGAKVLLLGVATEIIEEAKHKKCDLKVLDLEKQKIGLQLLSTDVENGNEADLEKEIQDCDYIVATGMIFVSETADRIFGLSKVNRKHLSLFMETGSNFGPQLLQYGADTVLSEFFPYYDFYGDTRYLVSRKDR